jgi:hypothetical protein
VYELILLPNITHHTHLQGKNSADGEAWQLTKARRIDA